MHTHTHTRTWPNSNNKRLSEFHLDLAEAGLLLFMGSASEGKSLGPHSCDLKPALNTHNRLGDHGLGFRVQGLGFRVQGSGFRV